MARKHFSSGFARVLALFLLFTFAVSARAQFSWVQLGATAMITKYTGTNTVVSIPSEIGGLPVTRIGPLAFAGGWGLTSVTIPHGITLIDREAFESCRGLTSVAIPDTVTNIEFAAFAFCSGVREFTVDPLNEFFSSLDGALVDKAKRTLIQHPAAIGGSYTIPTGITKVVISAFNGSSAITDVTIPATVEYIAYRTFSYCDSLRRIEVDPENALFSSSDDVLFDKAKSRLIGCAPLKRGNYTVPNGVAIIDYDGFFNCRFLTNVILPESLTTLQSNAFDSCSGLAGVYFCGDAPPVRSAVFYGATGAVVYCLPGRLGWGTTYAGRPVRLWQPQVLASGGGLGGGASQFGFNILWAPGRAVAIDACTDLAAPTWLPIQTNTVGSDPFHFSDPDWKNQTRRFYRLRVP